MASKVDAVSSAVQAALADPSALDALDQSQRMHLLGLLDQLRIAVEPPLVSLQKLSATHATLPAARIAQSMGIFDAFASAPPGAEMTVDALDTQTKGDRLLLARILKLLAADSIISEVRPGVYASRPLTPMLANGRPTGELIKHRYETVLVGARLHDYLEQTDFANPGDARSGPFQFAYGTDQHYFDWLRSHPTNLAAFNATMAMAGAYRGEPWFTYFPAAEKLVLRKGQSVALVDIGGSMGNDLVELKSGVPEIQGELILQDLPQVIDTITNPLPAGIRAAAHDMFNEQPVRNARAYYLRTVLHDWPDLQARQVLTKIVAAMTADSVLLLNENVLPETGASPFAARVDFVMMEHFASLERTEAQWRALLASSGLKVMGVYRPAGPSISSNAIFEAVLA